MTIKSWSTEIIDLDFNRLQGVRMKLHFLERPLEQVENYSDRAVKYFVPSYYMVLQNQENVVRSCKEAL